MRLEFLLKVQFGDCECAKALHDILILNACKRARHSELRPLLWDAAAVGNWFCVDKSHSLVSNSRAMQTWLEKDQCYTIVMNSNDRILMNSCAMSRVYQSGKIKCAYGEIDLATMRSLFGAYQTCPCMHVARARNIRENHGVRNINIFPLAFVVCVYSKRRVILGNCLE